ncbi:MAG: hypothetical protein KatS3mg093_430 [Candidatus Parcubacteria bacterium]|nr:MAG: hypothetical protein KatS3mg001_527 [Candidatus Pacearchaeota archaeon]GIW65451.1 MAG: hypothetical protein KatS3mg093_430 [Candidatus Parcubacteria bacterium]
MKKNFQLFLLLGIVIFLVSSINAVVVYGEWQNGKDEIEIPFGEDLIFNSDFFSMTPPMTINIKLYNSELNEIHSFEKNKVVSTNSFSKSYSIGPEIYKKSGDFEVILQASDNFPSSDNHVLKLKVKQEQKNNPPIAYNINITTEENKPVTFNLNATDPENDPLTFIIVSNPSNGSISNFNSSTGEITYTPNPSFFGTDSFSFKANDGKLDSNIAIVTITVNPIPKNKPPVIKSQPVTEVNENSQYSYQVIAEDEDGDSLTYSLEAPSWLSISSTGLISGIAPEVSEDVVFDVILRVSDGKDFSEQKYQLKVVNVNKPPVIKSQPVTEVNENSQYSYQVIAEDEDGDSLTYSLEAPSWLSISSTGLISGIAPEVSEDVVFDVILRVSDGKDFSEQKYQLKVVNVEKKEEKRERKTGGASGVRLIKPNPLDEQKYFSQFFPKLSVREEPQTIEEKSLLPTLLFWFSIVGIIILISIVLFFIKKDNF